MPCLPLHARCWLSKLRSRTSTTATAWSPVAGVEINLALFRGLSDQLRVASDRGQRVSVRRLGSRQKLGHEDQRIDELLVGHIVAVNRRVILDVQLPQIDVPRQV